MTNKLEENAQKWMDSLHGLNVNITKYPDCYGLFCDGEPVGWIYEGLLNLRHEGLRFVPESLRRASTQRPTREIVIPLHYVNAERLPAAVQDTANIRKSKGYFS